MQKIHFWTGNKSTERQVYETALLKKCLAVTSQEYGLAKLQVDSTDYPNADDEGNIFESGADVLVTVAGNEKFAKKDKIILPQPLTKGLLGYRLLVVRDESLAGFKQLNSVAQLQSLAIGIPETWVDAKLFRHNQYKVIEKGSFADLFKLLKQEHFDYVALGANEIEQIFQHHASIFNGLSIEPSLMLYYPFPLVFYINPRNPVLAQRIDKGFHTIMQNGEYESLFNLRYGSLVERLNLNNRRTFCLTNPMLPTYMEKFKATLLDGFC